MKVQAIASPFNLIPPVCSQTLITKTRHKSTSFLQKNCWKLLKLFRQLSHPKLLKFPILPFPQRVPKKTRLPIAQQTHFNSKSPTSTNETLTTFAPPSCCKLVASPSDYVFSNSNFLFRIKLSFVFQQLHKL